MVKHIILWKLKDEIADKASVKADLKSRKEKAAAQTNEDNILKAAVDNAKVEIPAAMIETTIDNMVQDITLRHVHILAFARTMGKA